MTTENTIETQQLEIIRSVLQIKDTKYLRRLQNSIRGKLKSMVENEIRAMEKREKELMRQESETNKAEQ